MIGPTLRRIVAGTAAMLLSLPVFAQALSSQPIRIIVPFPAGSGTDVVARLVASKLAPRLGQPVVIVNQTGSSGVIGTQTVARAKPDGHTLLLANSSHTILPSTVPDLPFDVLADFAPVTPLSVGPIVLVAHKNVPANNIQELVALAKSKPGVLNYASPGAGTVPHLATELLQLRTGIEMVHVPYRGGAPAVMDVMAGVIELYFSAPSTAMPHLQSGAIKALGLSSAKVPEFIQKMPIIGQTKPIQEQGVPDFDLDLWYGILAPGKTPADIIVRLQSEIGEILRMPDVRETMNRLGVEPKPSTADEFGRFMRAEVKLWSEVAQRSKRRSNGTPQ